MRSRIVQHSLAAEDRSVEELKDFIGAMRGGQRPEKLDIELVQTVEGLYAALGEQIAPPLIVEERKLRLTKTQLALLIGFLLPGPWAMALAISQHLF